MPKIVTVPDFDAAARAIVEACEKRECPKIIRLEGFCRAGKTMIGKLLAEKIGAAHVEGDQFVDKYEVVPLIETAFDRRPLKKRLARLSHSTAPLF